MSTKHIALEINESDQWCIFSATGITQDDFVKVAKLIGVVIE